MVYLTHRFQKIVKKHGGFRKNGNTGRSSNNVELCHRHEKLGKYDRDCPQNKD